MGRDGSNPSPLKRAINLSHIIYPFQNSPKPQSHFLPPLQIGMQALKPLPPFFRNLALQIPSYV